MKKTRYGLWIFLTEAAGILSGFLSRRGMEQFVWQARKPALSPPEILFPVVWTVLYGLMGVSAARIAVRPAGPERSRGLNLFVVQLVMNVFWSLIFFNAQAYGFALIWLLGMWVVIIGMIFAFRKVDRFAALFQLPYLLWVTFAAYLNYGVWQMNP